MVIDLSVEIGAVEMKNPVTVASGTFGFGEEFADFFDLSALGAIVTKSITLEPRLGNPPPRLVETPSGLVNSIGLQNPGLEDFLRTKLPFLHSLRNPVIVSIAGKSVNEYVTLARRLTEAEGIAALELNVSCPNVKGIIFGQEPKLLGEVVSRVKDVTELTLITKLSPNVTDIVTMAKVALEAGSDALAISNTFAATKIDIVSRRPKLGANSGGLSGPAIRPMVVHLVWKVHKALPQAPIIGMGGITCAEDALEYILAGARAVAVGTANLSDPLVSLKVLQGLESYCQQHHIERIRDLIGSVRARAEI